MSDDDGTTKRGAAAWWQAGLGGRPVVRNVAQGPRLLGGVLGAGSLTGCLDYAIAQRLEPVELTQSDEEMDVTMRALELQRSEGWNVGHVEQGLAFRGGVARDAADSVSWKSTLPSLAA